MALSVVTILLGRLSSPAIDEMKLLAGVGRDVSEIKDELETMRSFLQDADARGETNYWVKTWVRQVRDVAYDAEDILDEYYLRLVRPCNQGILSSLLNCLEYFKQLITHHSLATEMQQIKTRIADISKRMVTYDFNVIDEGRIVQWHDPRIAALHIGEADIVGIEVPKNILIGWLTEGELKLTLICVVGMGGLGKTTLVKKVYDSQMVKNHFDCHVWITVSQTPVTKDLLRATIEGVLKATKEQAPEEMDKMDVNKLIQVLKYQLSKKRYVIIFDDIWDINVWKTMKFAFPNLECGSRIIFTTRIGKVAVFSNYVHNLEPLKEQEAWTLFCMKAFGSNHGSSSTCPEELEELSRNILKKCRGLPLAIVLIGGLLAEKAKTVWAWKNVHDSMGAEMRNNYDLESLGRILLLSYNSLPYYLKPCFLYLSMFPEDYFIKRMKMIRLWIAEGFVEEKQGVTMEVVAGDYVNELISRSMIQIVELSGNEVKSCRIHDLMREIIQSKSKEEYFSTTIIVSQGTGVELHEKARRIAIYHNTCENNYSIGSRCSHIRSLMMFRLGESPARSFGDKFFRAFRLLRVLDLEGADLVDFPSELVELIHLRYLSLRSTKITVLPKSVGKLQNLETLDLKQTRVSQLPVEILKLQRLRHLLVYSYHSDSFNRYAHGVSVPTGIGNLTSLQKLAFLDVQGAGGGEVVLIELGKLTQLRRLGITNLKNRDEKSLCLSLEKMKHLTTLHIARSSTPDDNNEEEEFLELESLISPPQLLRHLYLDSPLMRLPAWIASLRNLVILRLQDSRLSCEKDDPLKAFQRMPNLMCLILSVAYDGEELCCTEVGGFRNLKTLLVLEMDKLKRMRFVKGSMLMLTELHIGFCPVLEMVPYGIEHLSGLQVLRLYGMHLFVERIRKRRPRSPPPSQGEAQGGGGGGGGGGEDWWRVQNIPTIRHHLINTEGLFVVVDDLR